MKKSTSNVVLLTGIIICVVLIAFMFYYPLYIGDKEKKLKETNSVKGYNQKTRQKLATINY
jgi:H+/gluconate symporter-like permease